MPSRIKRPRILYLWSLISSNACVGDTLSTKKDIEKPIVADYYNQYMSGCDRADQMVGYYGHQTRRSTKWWKKLFFWAMEIAMMNSFIMFKDTRPRPFQKNAGRALTFLNFKKNLIKQLESKAVDMTDLTAVSMGGAGDAIRSPVGRPKKRKIDPSAIEITTPGQHIVTRGEKLRRCEVCKKNDDKKGSRTYYFCQTCPSKPSIHPDCFATFHRS